MWSAAGLAVSLFASAAQADDPALGVHPLAGLFGVDDSVCSAATAARSLQARVAPTLCQAFDTIDERAYWGRRFQALMGVRFAAQLRPDLHAPPADGLGPEAVLSQTMVASLHLTRADLWTVRKPSAVEVHVPITVSLMMTNVLTGEVMFVENLSTDVVGLMSPGDWERQVTSQFAERFDAALVALVDAAYTHFRPGAIRATVRGRSGDRYVVDVGRRGGLREGDEIGADARVIFADADYSVVEPVLGTLNVGAVLTRGIAQPVDNLSRPSLLVVTAETPDGFGEAYLKTVVEDAVATSAGFALTTVNPDSAQIRGPALGAVGLGARPRPLPDYFLRVSAVALQPIEADTNVEGARRRVQEARVFLEVINHEGRVVFATQGVDRQVDEIVAGMAPSTQQRRDAAVRNAIHQATTFLDRDFNPSRLRLQLQPDDDGVVVQDPGGVLSVGAQAVVVRRVGRMTGIQGDVWIPVSEVEVNDVSGGTARARYAGVETPRVRGGDQIAYEAAGAGAPSRLSVAQCLTNGSPAISVRGLPQPGFQPIAVNSFAGGFRGVVQIRGFPDELARLQLGSVFAGYGSLGAATASEPDVCFEPVHQVVFTDERPEGRNFSISRYQLTAGYVLRRGGERVGGTGLGQTLSATATPRTADADYKSASLQIDLAEAMTDLTRRAAGEITPP